MSWREDVKITLARITTLRLGSGLGTEQAPVNGPESYVLVTDEASHQLLAANSGKLHIIPDMTADSAILLPAEADGLRYRFVYGGSATDAHDHTFDSGADANYYQGGLSFLDLDAGDAADEVHAGIYSDGNSNSILTISNIAIGTEFEIVCNGTIWYISGQVVSDTAPGFADQ